MSDLSSLPEWERLLATERHPQQLVPGSVLVGGTAAALHTGHRRSLDGDLEAAAGWATSRVQRPVAILGALSASLLRIRGGE